MKQALLCTLAVSAIVALGSVEARAWGSMPDASHWILEAMDGRYGEAADRSFVAYAPPARHIAHRGRYDRDHYAKAHYRYKHYAKKH